MATKRSRTPRRADELALELNQEDQGDENDELGLPGISQNDLANLKERFRQELEGSHLGFSNPDELPDIPGAKKHASKDGVVLK